MVRVRWRGDEERARAILTRLSGGLEEPTLIILSRRMERSPSSNNVALYLADAEYENFNFVSVSQVRWMHSFFGPEGQC